MKAACRVLSMIVLLSSVATFARSGKVRSVSELVDQFYAQKITSSSSSRLLSRNSLRPPVNCYPNPNSQACLDSACKKLGSFGCDDLDEIQEVSKSCRGNIDSTCLDTTCSKLGSFGCDDLDEIQTVARACVGNYDMSCFQNVCSRLGHFGCDDIEEVQEVLKSCSGY